MKKRLYVAYGSNLNKRQMKYRCPTAKLVGTGVIRDYGLQFKGLYSSAFATIAPKRGERVPVAVWEIKPMDERALDLYEGYPKHYVKQMVPVEMEGETIKAMVYVMNQNARFGVPTAQYYGVVREGYRDCGLDESVLKQALVSSMEQAAGETRQSYHVRNAYQRSSQGVVESSLDEAEDDDFQLTSDEGQMHW